MGPPVASLCLKNKLDLFPDPRRQFILETYTLACLMNSVILSFAPVIFKFFWLSVPESRNPIGLVRFDSISDSNQSSSLSHLRFNRLWGWWKCPRTLACGLASVRLGPGSFTFGCVRIYRDHFLPRDIFTRCKFQYLTALNRLHHSTSSST